ncbi:hypothetical protein DPV78_000169 [Talaromyces pinophilus]|nr:hypothetical protein DPV78_000169 [Talaromyces pinophilus]
MGSICRPIQTTYPTSSPLKGFHKAQPLRIQKFFQSNYFRATGFGLSKESILRATQCSGYSLARALLPDQSADSWQGVLDLGLNKLEAVFREVQRSVGDKFDTQVVAICLSSELVAWRDEQHKAGRILPAKGYGITRVSDAVVDLLGVGDWPPPLLTNAALFGSGLLNFLLGAYDSRVLYSNYCSDMGFFYEHGYDKVFPEYQALLEQAGTDTYALSTVGGRERRAAAELGLRYIRTKIVLEEKHIAHLSNKTATLNREDALALNFCESSLWGMAAEMIAQGYDCGGIVNDFAFSCPSTDVVDVGSDIHNSELFNSFLNTADITQTGVVTEEALRRIYDAQAHCGARMFTERWSEPGARMCSFLYIWHIVNDRHNFLRRAVLGYCKARSSRPTQKIADFEEAFSDDLHTTGFSHPLISACNGEAICDHVEEHLAQSHGDPLLKDLWYYMADGPLEYASKGIVNKVREDYLIEGLRIAVARAYSYALIDELAWFAAHASHHAWQVNYLFEAAMFGSILDDGGLIGRLDRVE